MDASMLEQDVLDQLYDGLYLVDAERRICLWNRAAQEITGYSREEMLGHHCFDDLLRHVDDGGHRLCHDGCPLLATLGDGERREARVYLQHRNGHRMPVEIRVSPLRDAAGAIVGAVEVFNDGGRRLAERRRLEELEREATLDPLTQLGNRRRFDAALAARLRELAAAGTRFGLLLADLDHFKHFNDTWGHPTGDDLLRRVARTLELAVRVGDDVCRYGGEEFAILAAAEDTATLMAIAERLRALVAAIELEAPADVERVGVSAGVALAEPDDTAATLVARADRALYDSKRFGRNRVTAAA